MAAILDIGRMLTDRNAKEHEDDGTGRHQNSGTEC
jgi:hypothetical protein